jgi:cytochrome c oxidase assembly protein subunit 15
MSHASPPGPYPWLRAFSFLLVAMTLALIFLGGLVKSHEAGLAVPDWPTTYGQNMFLYPPSEWTGGIFYEHTHRLLASAVGFITLILCIWAAWTKMPVWFKMVASVALIMVVMQGILGGLTVLLMLPTAVSVSHGVLAQTFLVVTVLIAYTLSREAYKRREAPAEDTAAPRVTPWAVVLMVAIFGQLILGAVMRHSDAGLAVPDFPLMGGQVVPMFNDSMYANIAGQRTDIAFEYGMHLPAVTTGQVAVHLLHRLGAVLIIVAAVMLTLRARRFAAGNRRVLRTVYALDALILAQATLGILTIWTIRQPTITSLHVVLGAGLLALCTVLVLRCLPIAIEPNEAEADAPAGAPQSA